MRIEPQPNEKCWKDTITVYPGEVVTIRVHFAQQDGTSFPFDTTAGPGYVWHCHLLEHEDNEMMRPYKVTQNSSLALPLAAFAVAVAAVASVLGYSCQRKRKKRQVNATHNDRIEIQQLEENADETEITDTI